MCDAFKMGRVAGFELMAGCFHDIKLREEALASRERDEEFKDEELRVEESVVIFPRLRRSRNLLKVCSPLPVGNVTGTQLVCRVVSHHRIRQAMQKIGRQKYLYCASGSYRRYRIFIAGYFDHRDRE